jgi:hypothetical protein
VPPPQVLPPASPPIFRIAEEASTLLSPTATAAIRRARTPLDAMPRSPLTFNATASRSVAADQFELDTVSQFRLLAAADSADA